MKFQVTRTFAASREAVWTALNETETLQACIPGCKEFTGSPKDGFTAVVKRKVGPIKATFKVNVMLSDVVPLTSYTLTAAGTGRMAGVTKGRANVTLGDADGGGTDLHYDIDTRVGGMIAKLGSRRIDSFMHRMSDRFLERLQTRLEGGAMAQSPGP